MIFLFGGPTLKISELCLGKYEEIVDEIHRFGSFGLYLAKQGNYEKFLKYKDVVSGDR